MYIFFWWGGVPPDSSTKVIHSGVESTTEYHEVHVVIPDHTQLANRTENK